MRTVIQRVSQAQVKVSGKTAGHIGPGLLVLLGVSHTDTDADAKILAQKIATLRIMADADDKMNLSVKDVQGEILIVSQFTLFADTHKGNRPSFIAAAPPELAQKLYLSFINHLKSEGVKVQAGEFGAMMQVSLVNDGPVTIILDTHQPHSLPHI